MILAHLENKQIITEEIHRFPNGLELLNGEKVWNVDYLFQEILAGLKKCKQQEKIPYCLGIDTWAVDYVLLDENDQRIGNAVCYRDSRTDGMDEEVSKFISEEDLYKRTGIQKQIFNTIYQLMSLKVKKPEQLNQAKTLLMIPDYLNFLLTSAKAQEYTNATTTQLVSVETNDWDYELIDLLGYPKDIFQKIVEPGTFIGNLKEEIVEQVGFDCKVIAPATHDTGSAVAAVPAIDDDSIYISSGTWSLMGVETKKPNCSLESKQLNFTSEGGVDYRFRFLKNIMGLWIIQSIQKEIASDMSFGEICSAAKQAEIPSLVDVNDSRFLAPENMTEEIISYCKETNQQVPNTVGEIASVVYNSLAVCYGDTVKEIETLTGKTYQRINVIGGGANAEYLNELTAKYTGKVIEAGPTEATAIGNLVVQMIANKEFASLQQARQMIRDSFEIKIYEID